MLAKIQMPSKITVRNAVPRVCTQRVGVISDERYFGQALFGAFYSIGSNNASRPYVFGQSTVTQGGVRASQSGKPG